MPLGYNPAYTTEDRFWAKVKKAEPELCWAWIAGTLNTGYGRFVKDGRKCLAHRVAWEYTYGPIPKKMFVCHHCDNKNCVNPGHLYLGTNGTNIRDYFSKGNAFVRRGEDSRMSKINNETVLKIRELHATGKYTYEQVARLANTSLGIVKGVLSGKTWRHV